jgi:predicted cobalt transporter CbtA
MAVHVPKESFPRFVWYVIEFGIMLGIGIGISLKAVEYFQELGMTESMTNWIFWGIVGAPMVIYYIIIRSHIFKKPILEQ